MIHESMRMGEEPGSVVTKSAPTSIAGRREARHPRLRQHVLRMPSDEATVSE